MGKFIRLKKGFNINLAGKAASKVTETDQAETFVIKPTDFHGIYMPKSIVKEGDIVKVKVLDVDKQGRIRLSMKDVEAGE